METFQNFQKHFFETIFETEELNLNQFLRLIYIVSTKIRKSPYIFKKLIFKVKKNLATYLLIV